MASRDNRSRLLRFLRSFLYASQGFRYLVKNEQNFLFHLIAGSFVLIAGLILELSVIKMCILLTVIGIMLSLEALNTGIERSIDLITEKEHPIAKVAKDVSAAAVFLFAVISVIIGILLFFEPIVHLFQS
ncbi:diacylglycerol kinase family protein [Guptibacillus hwajinpoensis]|uniref:diacylglycerol kinase family protein n=1 Tax=Guptibacillus hwajinpoensis TaxID=208199 RepID=UPI001CFCBA0F|nr:diacylglycerol kinase family protein [Pseudalkalibacillus hwajinpoensis]WLR60582.1 diacylglycerol kinase family protein [Pseudalkalibacillus hwajinpoensis]